VAVINFLQREENVEAQKEGEGHDEGESQAKERNKDGFAGTDLGRVYKDRKW
jgi:hypothetical protein